MIVSYTHVSARSGLAPARIGFRKDIPVPILPPCPDEFLTSALISDVSSVPLPAHSRWQLARFPVRPGVEVMLQRGTLAEALHLRVRNDGGRIQFSVPLSGRAQCRTLETQRALEHHSDPHSCTIEYAPDQRWDLRFADGAYHSIKLMLSPDVFAHWCQDMDAPLQQAVQAGRCFAVQRSEAQIRLAAQQLAQSLEEDGIARPRLWLESQAMALVALLMQQRMTPAPAHIAPAEARALAAARDRLLSDLSRAPSIAELARLSGLSVLKLKRGFRQHYGLGVYGVFLRERMHEARRRLLMDDSSVMQVAAHLGYTNASHFAAAFRRQFGVSPGELRRFDPGRT